MVTEVTPIKGQNYQLCSYFLQQHLKILDFIYLHRNFNSIISFKIVITKKGFLNQPITQLPDYLITQLTNYPINQLTSSTLLYYAHIPLLLHPRKNAGDKIYYLTKKIREMSNYELMVIFTPVLSDDEFKSVQKKYCDFITDNGGTITHSNPWGLKSLAYPIQKKTTGIYWVLEYGALSSFNEKLLTQLLRDEKVLRHMFTVLDKYAVGYNDRKRNGVKHFEPKNVEV